MKRILLSLLLLLSLALPANAQRTPAAFGAVGTFQTAFESGDGVMYGTAFCVPGKSNVLMTAAHAAGMGVWIIGPDKQQHEVRVLSKDDAKDIAVLYATDPLCQFAPYQWASKNAAPGDAVWLYGWGGVRPMPILTRGTISSEVGVSDQNPLVQAAQLNALFGHSGGPVFNAANQIVGMLVGGFVAGDEMDVIVPVEALRKAIR